MEPRPLPQRSQTLAKWIFVVLGVGAVALTVALITSKPLLNKLRTPSAPPVIITTATVQANDVFSVMLTRRGLQAKYEPGIEKAFRTIYNPQSIQPGHFFEIITSTDGVFQKFIYQTDAIHSFVVTRSSENVYSASTNTEKTVWIEKRMSVVVTKFLESDLRSAGYDATLIDNLTYELGESIFGWKIDFFTEQRKGDKLDVLLEEEYLIGSDKPLKGGKHMRVLAASYTGTGTRVKENLAIRYQAPDQKRADFFDPDGKAMQRQFLRAPFTKGVFRVSSGFNPHRLHPILRVYRPHHGTDYAASIGTPVSAIGSGTVVRAEWYKGYGNCVDIRHSTRYTSRYGHLSKIAVRQGQSIAQGQYIGKVGNTGLSTGPHLHFEMLVDGAQRNFLSMSFPAASSVAKANMPDFLRVRDEMLARLNARPVDQPKQVSMVVAK